MLLSENVNHDSNKWRLGEGRGAQIRKERYRWTYFIINLRGVKWKYKIYEECRKKNERAGRNSPLFSTAKVWGPILS